MLSWQLIVLGVLVVIPFALIPVFWPHRERHTVAGRPLERSWRPVFADRKPR